MVLLVDDSRFVSGLVSQDRLREEENISSAHPGTADRVTLVVDFEGTSQKDNLSIKSRHSDNIDSILAV